MIVLSVPRNVPDWDRQNVQHVWTKQAALWGTDLIVQDHTARELALWWDRANGLNERLMFVSPLFVPLPSAWEELDYLRKEDQLVVALKDYDPVWTLDKTVQTWVERDLSPHCLVLQLAGQTRVLLPASTHIGPIMSWLERSTRSTVYRAPGYYAGPRQAVRYRIGEVFRDPFGPGGDNRAWGTDVLGRTNWFTKREAYQQWVEAVAGWGKWLNKR